MITAPAEDLRRETIAPTPGGRSRRLTQHRFDQVRAQLVDSAPQLAHHALEDAVLVEKPKA